MLECQGAEVDNRPGDDPKRLRECPELLPSPNIHLLTFFLTGLTAAECAGSFWDAVVFSVGDKAQRKAMETQIQTLKDEKSIPLVEYIAIEDDPSYKMGECSGNMYLLTSIRDYYGETLWTQLRKY